MEVKGVGAAIFVFAYQLCQKTTVVLQYYFTSFGAAGNNTSLLLKQYAEDTERKLFDSKSDLQTLECLYTQDGAT